MTAPRRLVTFVELDDSADGNTACVSARHELELDDGTRILLLGDRGWGVSGSADVWAYICLEDLRTTARAVVGPDEPYADRTDQDMADAHWDSLQRTATQQDVSATAAQLRQLPHDVVVGPRLRALVAT